jgi:hypothetical protein
VCTFQLGCAILCMQWLCLSVFLEDAIFAWFFRSLERGMR